MLLHDICTSLMGRSPHPRSCWTGSLWKVDRMGIQVSCKEAMFAVTAVCSFKVASQKPNNKSKQNQTEHWAVARGKEKCYSSLLFQLRVRQKCVCVGAMTWPRMCNLKLTEHRWWFLLESARCSSFAHFSYIKKKPSKEDDIFLFLFSWSVTFWSVHVALLSLFLTGLMEGGNLSL